MSDFSDYMEDAVIEYFLRNDADTFTPVATLYVALFTANTGLEANNPTSEVSGGSYARVALSLSAASGGATSNPSDLIWTQATADWGTVTSAAIVDHATNTTWGTDVNVYMWSDLAAPKTINNGDVFKILAGELDVSVA